MMSENVIEIDNAGLVLITPFFTHLFRSLGYLDVMRFVDEAAHLKAMYVLQYMVKQDDYAKGSLYLNALLCGWPQGREIGPAPELTAIEKQQADLAVNAMAAHWMQETSVDALRQGFFMRHGTLETAFPPVLQVQKQPQDVLLQRLPWIYAIIRTPWSELMKVDWPA